MAGISACDDRAIGAYGAEVIFQRNLVKYCEICSFKLKLDSKIYGEEMIHRIIVPKERAAILED